jgi:uncharacterized protein YbdZ (MbtH family)
MPPLAGQVWPRKVNRTAGSSGRTENGSLGGLVAPLSEPLLHALWPEAIDPDGHSQSHKHGRRSECQGNQIVAIHDKCVTTLNPACPIIPLRSATSRIEAPRRRTT